ncbi:MAG TPA: hypothetical protein VJ719_14850 [Chthoniobacterales bacterium]|nr:hypothetical protein [Chthoniobacterales bacterium]
MKTAELAIPEVGAIALTRAILGVGIGLLIQDKIPERQRPTIGWICVAVGILTTIPLAFHVFGEAE